MKAISRARGTPSDGSKGVAHIRDREEGSKKKG